MNETIHICEQDGKVLKIIDTKKLLVELNEAEMELYTTYNRKQHIVSAPEGTLGFFYIVV